MPGRGADLQDPLAAADLEEAEHRRDHAGLETREEDLAVLLVDTRHPKVQVLYESWGYRKVGERQPFPDSPVFAVMLTELPLRQ